jgi:DNA-binding MarR family transcriptional regulator
MTASETVESVYHYLCQYIKKEGIAPTQREIAKGCYISQPTVIRSLDILEAQGRISRKAGLSRSISIKPTE